MRSKDQILHEGLHIVEKLYSGYGPSFTEAIKSWAGQNLVVPRHVISMRWQAKPHMTKKEVVEWQENLLQKLSMKVNVDQQAIFGDKLLLKMLTQWAADNKQQYISKPPYEDDTLLIQYILRLWINRVGNGIQYSRIRRENIVTGLAQMDLKVSKQEIHQMMKALADIPYNLSFTRSLQFFVDITTLWITTLPANDVCRRWSGEKKSELIMNQAVYEEIVESMGGLEELWKYTPYFDIYLEDRELSLKTSYIYQDFNFIPIYD